MSKCGIHNGNWKGGKSIASNGYVIVRVGTQHHLSDVRGYAYEHRLVAESKLKRKLKPGEVAHHANGNRQDNRPENIEVMKSTAHHANQHRKKISGRRLADQQNPIIQCACGCRRWFNRFDAGDRPRRFISGHNPPDITRQKRFIEACGHGSRLNRVAEKTGQSLQACKCMASKLVRENKIARKGRGIYGRTH